MQTQAALRARISEARAALPKERREKMALSAAKRVLALKGYIESDVVMAYAATAHEIDPSSIVAHARENGKRVCFPVVSGETMLAMEPFSESAFLRGAFGILEPDPDASRVVEGSAIGCILVPGVVFDEYGSRIGRGKGYYDRFLEGLPAYRIGLAYECQIVDCIDSNSHDARMDAVATEERLMMARINGTSM